jgi:hypothetical protein
MTRKRLKIQRLSDRHPGVTPALSLGYYEAACVCLDRHHASPQEMTIIENAWANSDDTTEAGAYCLAPANAEIMRGLVAVSRAQGRTGVDYYLGSADSPLEDLEASVRLEVSGTDDGKLSTIKSRLRQKLEQVGRVESNLPALATVVAFAVLRIESADVKSE